MHLVQQMPSVSHSLGTCVLALPALPWPLQQAKFMVQVLNKNRRPSGLNHTHHFIRFLGFRGLELLVGWTALMTHEGHTPPGMRGNPQQMHTR